MSNLTDEKKNVVFYLAAYDRSGVLETLRSEHQTLYGKGAGTIFSAKIETSENTKKVKVFLWDEENGNPYGGIEILKK